VDLVERLAVRRPDDVRERDPGPLHVRLDEDGDVHVVEQDDLVPPAAVGMHPAVLVDGPGQVGDDERREREPFAGAGPVLADRPPRVGDVDLQQRMHCVLAVHQAQPVDHLVLCPREGLHPTGGPVTRRDRTTTDVHAADPAARARAAASAEGPRGGRSADVPVVGRGEGPPGTPGSAARRCGDPASTPPRRPTRPPYFDETSEGGCTWT
jgi:hypothetical protein